MLRTLGFALSLILFSQGAFALLPPWVVLQNQVKATLGSDHCVKVDFLAPVGNSFNLDVHVICRGESRAQAISDFVSTTHDFGGIDVTVRVFDSRGHLVSPQPFPADIEAKKKVIHAALRTNPYFDGFQPGNIAFDFFIELTKCVVQYPADDISDSHGNINQVAADAFRQVLRLDEITTRVGTGTSLQACEEQSSSSSSL